ncbi:MAG: class I SAM-dependent methyltransferase [Polyangiaceae bacterium]
MKRSTSSDERFDDAYYDRYYRNPKTRVQTPQAIAKLARGVLAMAAYWDIPIDSALDVGAGLGWWKAGLLNERPSLKYRGVDISAAACKAAGLEQRDISRWRDNEKYDLVICQGVLQYLTDRACALAIENLAAMTSSLLYLEALTRHDVDEVVDLERTDSAVHLRTGAWYRERLDRHYIPLGCGLYCSRLAAHPFFELETASV